MFFFFSSRRRHTRCSRDWSSDVCSSDLDRYQANGLPGANGIADVLDEARWGLEWLLEMYPEDDLLLNQLGDDRDHAFWDVPAHDSSDYGWGRGGRRPVYPCTGKPQGLFNYKNRSDRKSTRLNSSHGYISYAVFCLKKKKKNKNQQRVSYMMSSTMAATGRSKECTRGCRLDEQRKFYLSRSDQYGRRLHAPSNAKQS